MVKRNFTDETYEMAKKELLSGGKITQVCGKYKINEKTFALYLEKDGVYKRQETTISQGLIEKIKELRLQRWGCKRIAKEIGCNEKTVARYVKKMGIKVEAVKQTNREKNGKYDLMVDFFKNIDDEKSAYWLGFLFADGNIAKNRITIRLNTDDKHHLEQFQKHIKFNGEIVDKEKDTNFKKKSKNSTIEVNCTDMVRDLNQYMPIGKKSDKIQLPKLNDELYKHFIRGYFDGDGFVIKTRQQIGFCSNVAFLESIKQKFIELGFATKKDGYLSNSPGPYYGELVFGKKVSKKVMDWMYENASIYLKRKYNDFYNAKVDVKPLELLETP